MIRYTMRNDDFVQLINGKIIQSKTHNGEAIQVTMQDIGLHRIRAHIDNAIDEIMAESEDFTDTWN